MTIGVLKMEASVSLDDKAYDFEDSSKGYDVYVAYCEKDIEFALEITKHIEKEGLSCYFKDRDEDNGFILENLCTESLKSRFVLIIFTKDSLKDCLIKFLILQSLHYTLEYGLLTLVFLLHNIDRENLPKEVQFVPHVFTSENNYFRKLMEKLNAPKVSIDNLLPVGNISSGLAWSFYYGYLKLILPEIPVQIDRWISRNSSKKCYFPKRIYILLPISGSCHSSLSEVDKNIEFVETFATREIHRAGNMHRKYQNTIYKICKADKEYYLVCEYASPLKTMFEMEMGQIAGLTKTALIDQIHLFKNKLSEILNHKDCKPHDCCTLVICPNDILLSDVLVEQIEKDLKDGESSP